MFSTATLLFRNVSVGLHLNINFLYDDGLKKIENIIETLKSWTGKFIICWVPTLHDNKARPWQTNGHMQSEKSHS